jgi:hypothetical protein
MLRRRPPRKVTYFETVPPRLARNTIIESFLCGGITDAVVTPHHFSCAPVGRSGFLALEVSVCNSVRIGSCFCAISALRCAL